MARKMIKRPDGLLIYTLGMSRSGKTHWLKQQIKTAKRILVWDSKAEYCMMPGYTEVKTLSELAALMAKHFKGPCKLAYTGPLSTFKEFCYLAYKWLVVARGVLVVEELADVTTPGKACDGWGDICRKSLAYGPLIFAVSQRPQEADKTVYGMASMIHCHMMGNEDDSEKVAKSMGVKVADMPVKKYEFIQVVRGEPIKRGRTKA